MRREQLHISTIAEDAVALAREHGLGLELAEFCTAMNMDVYFSDYDPLVRRALAESRAKHLVFHGPFSELCPAAVDPGVREHSRRRYLQAAALAQVYGIRRLVFHTGYIPMVYYREWFVPKSVEFWKSILEELPADVELLLENVMEDGPEMLAEIAAGVADPRLGICLDVGHAQTLVSNLEIRAWISGCAPWLRHVHLHNNRRQQDLHSPLGEGDIPMDQVLEQLEQLGLPLTYTIENQRAAASVTWLLDHGFLT